MKKIVVLIAVIIFSFQFSQAQLQVGPKVGLTGYQLISGGNDGVKMGLLVGGFVDYELNNKFNLQADIAYVEKGSKDGDTKTHLNYISFAPNIKIFTKIEDNRGFYISTGLGFNFLTTEKITFDGEEIANDLGLNTFDLSLQLGIGYKFDNDLSIDLKVVDGSLTTASSEIDNLRNIGANLTLAYGFDF